MPAREINFIREPARKAFDEADIRVEAGKARLESEPHITEILQFERGYN